MPLASEVSVHLETGTGRSIANPSASQISDELAALPGGTDSFAILSRDELTYIQTAGSPTEGFLLEYQEGSLDRHHRSTESNLPLGTVTQAFQRYAAGDSSWSSLVAWERNDMSHSSSGFPITPVALIAAVALGLAVWWWRAA